MQGPMRLRRRCVLLVWLWIYRTVTAADVSGDNHENAVSGMTMSAATTSQCEQESQDHGPAEFLDCGVWLARSTIPNAGLGMYAGRDYEQGEQLQPTGDVVIPLVDIHYHAHAAGQQGNGQALWDASAATGGSFRSTTRPWLFLWTEYTWYAVKLHMHKEGMHEVNAASPGFGAAPNCFLPLYNLEEWNPKSDMAGLHRSRDPGAGAFSAYYDRRVSAYQKISAGMELFASYGEVWFTTREIDIGPVPLTMDDLEQANELVQKLWQIHHNLTIRGHPDPTTLIKDVWQDLMLRSSFNTTSRVLGAYVRLDPKQQDGNDNDELIVLRNQTLANLRKQQSKRSIEWLHRHGQCADHMTAGFSNTLPQAGRGAFATRDLSAGTIVAPMPLIHISDRDQLQMFGFAAEESTSRTTQRRMVPSRKAGLIGHQLMLNYCFGHAESSLLLCPYGVMTGYINHNQTLANVRLQWADPARSNHQPEFLSQPIERLDDGDTAKLALELVATRDIIQGEEILLDYGDEWEHAWLEHIAQWKPVSGAKEYIAAWQNNQDTQTRLRTVFEQIDNPYPNKELLCDGNLIDDSWRIAYENDDLDDFLAHSDSSYLPCDILRHQQLESGACLYTVYVLDGNQAAVDEENLPSTTRLVEYVPRPMFRFFDAPYTSDIFLTNAFRHDMRIPDDLFPDAWRNRKKG